MCTVQIARLSGLGVLGIIIFLFSMATSLAEKINQNFLHCGICLEPFKKPRALPCLHSFCEECLERWTKANTKGSNKPRVIVCPNCQKAATIPAEGIQGFPAHFLVNSLQSTVNMEKVGLCTLLLEDSNKIHIPTS